MRVIVFGASGMVGQGVLHASLLEPDITEVLAVVRTPLDLDHPKLRQLVHTDFTDYTAIQGELTDLDACFFCLGVTAVGRSEQEYTRITYDYTLAAARAVSAHSPQLTFVYVTGEGTDSTERGRLMWARVKGRTENALLAMDFDAYMFRPGFIQPRNGAVARVTVYRLLYRLTGRLYPLLRRLTPKHVTTTEHLGRAMIAVTRLKGQGPTVLHSPEINRLGAAPN